LYIIVKNGIEVNDDVFNEANATEFRARRGTKEKKLIFLEDVQVSAVDGFD
jgi:hypothetical protein